VFSPLREAIFVLREAFEPSPEAILPSKWEKMPLSERLDALKEVNINPWEEKTPPRSVFSPPMEDIFVLGEAFEPSPEAIFPFREAKMPVAERQNPPKEAKYQSMEDKKPPRKGF